MKTNWTDADIPSQTGKTAVVTGANSGIGFYAAQELARAGAEVILAVRNQPRGDEAAAKIRKEVPGAKLSVELAELSSLDSVRAMAASIAAKHPKLDILINNAALMMMPKRDVTQDGFEVQMGVNYLSHFALTGLLLPNLLASPQARVVSLGSSSIRVTKPAISDLQSEQEYKPLRTYAKSKLAGVLFSQELARRAKGTNIVSAAAHPGFTMTAGQNLDAIGMFFTKLIAQPGPHGAWPILYAATEADVQPGKYYGPKDMGGMRGSPRIEDLPPGADDAAAAKTLWEESEKLTGVKYGLPG